jgi:hypothetical protein
MIAVATPGDHGGWKGIDDLVQQDRHGYCRNQRRDDKQCVEQQGIADDAPGRLCAEEELKVPETDPLAPPDPLGCIEIFERQDDAGHR